MHILFAEDDRQLRASVTRGLREASHTVEQAGNGTQALALATSHEFDAVILDVLLPGKSGTEVCSALRASGNRVPILMLTARDAIEHRIEGLDAGADDYLTKPFDFGELLARLRALTRRGGEGLERLVVGDLVIDAARRTVHRGDREITLTAKEFAFLSYLARHAGRAVSRAELMAHVWDDSNSYSNIIDVYASRLRRKIDEGEDDALFTTLRSVGFILQAPAAARKSRRPNAPRTAPRRG
jgi:DNA-binding response OmpR family regulator